MSYQVHHIYGADHTDHIEARFWGEASALDYAATEHERTHDEYEVTE